MLINKQYYVVFDNVYWTLNQELNIPDVLISILEL